MTETIYTIPVNNAFENNDDCPICKIYKMLEKNEVDIILGASMMEPDIRIKTNNEGFCKKHYEDLAAYQKRLPLALILETHMDTLIENLNTSTDKQIRTISENNESCYICNRIKNYLAPMYHTLFYLYSNDNEFKRKLENQTQFCLPHYKTLLEIGKNQLNKKDYLIFSQTIDKIEKNHLEKLAKDIKWFVKKFDYRYTDEPWNDAKDSIERIIKTLISK